MQDTTNTMAEAPLVYCIVLNWNGWKDTLDCLDSLAKQRYERLKVIVVDNGSTDESVDEISQAFPSVWLIRNGANLGFAGGNNVGIRMALDEGADFIWLLNNDTLVPPDTAEKLVAKALQVPKAGEVGSVLYHMNEPDTVQAWGGATLSPWNLYRPELVTAPRKFMKNTALMGASVLLRRETLREVGLLDDSYFMDFEDSDLSFRIQKAGWGLVVAEDTRILHKGGASFQGQNLKRIRFSTASYLRFVQRHGRLSSVVRFVFCISVLFNRVRRRDWIAFEAIRAGIRDAKG